MKTIFGNPIMSRSIKNMVFIFLMMASITSEAQNKCSQLFKSNGHVEQNQINELTVYIDNVLNLLITNPLIKNKTHPRKHHLGNIDQLGKFQNEMYTAFPQLRRLEVIKLTIDKNRELITEKQFRLYLTSTYNQMQTRFKDNPVSAIHLWAFTDSMQIIKSLIPYIKPPDQKKDDQKKDDQKKDDQKKDDQKKDDQKKDDQKKDDQKKDDQKKDDQKKDDQKKDDQKKDDQKKDDQKKDDQKKDDQKKDDQKKDDQKKDDQKQEKKKLDEEKTDKYDVHNKDLQDGGKSSPQFAIFYTVPAPKKLLKDMAFDNVDQQLIKLPHLRQVQTQKLTIYTEQTKFNESMIMINQQEAMKLTLPVPYGVQPAVGDYGSYRVVETLSGEYSVFSKSTLQPLPKKIKIGLIPIQKINLSAAEINHYTQKSHIKKTDWPDHVQKGIDYSLIEKTAQDKVKILSQWFQTDGPYLYNSRNKDIEAKYDEIQKNIAKKSLTKPFELVLAEETMFNCDGAALIGARLVRDYLQIPARVAGGRTMGGVLGNKNGALYRAMNLNDPKHAWVEVFISGEWIPFDFTPTKNAPKSNSENQDKKKQDPNDSEAQQKDKSEQKKSDSKDDQKDKSDQKSDSKEKGKEKGETSDSKESGDPSKGGGGEGKSDGGESDGKKNEGLISQKKKNDGKDVKPQTESDSKKSDDKASDKPTDSKKESTKSDSDKNKSDSNTKKQELKEHDTKSISNEVFELPKNYDSPMGAFFRQNLVDSIDLFLKKGPVVFIKQTLESAIEKANNYTNYVAATKMNLNKILDSFTRENDKSIYEILKDAKVSAYKSPTLTHQKLKLILGYYESKSELQKLSADEKQFVSQLQHLIQSFSDYRHKNSSQHQLVDDMLSNLPGKILRDHILKKSPTAQSIGSVDQQTLFNEITKGKWAGAYQASLVNKYLNFFLNSEKEYKSRRIQTALRSYTRERKSEGLVTAGIKDIADFQRWILDPEIGTDAAMTFLGKLIKDEQYMMGNRQMVTVSGRTTPIERKHTNVFFDISGSMGGQKANIQASAIAAMVDQFLSETDPFGKPLHTVMLFPFGSNVRTGVYVSTKEQAEKVILSFLNTATDSNDGTEFQPCFDRHFEVIRRLATDNEFKFKLKKSNMVLITDGEANVDLNKVQKDLNALPADMKTFFNLVVLGGKAGDDLKSIVAATNTEKSKSMITEISDQQMSQFSQEAQNPKIDPNAFIYDNSKGVVSADIIQGVQSLKLPTTQNLATITNDLQIFKNEIKGFPTIELKSALLIREVDRLILQYQKSNPTRDAKLKTTMTVLTNYQKWGGNPLSRVSYAEEMILQKLIDETDK